MREEWKYCTLEELVTTINGLWKGKKEPFVNVGVIRNANFNKDITLNYSNIEYLNVEERQYKTRKLQSGDLIVEKSGGSEKQPVGRTVLFRGEGEFSVSNFTSILRIKDQNIIFPEFLYKYLLFIYYSGATKAMQKATTGIHNILFDKFLAIQVPIPSLHEQQCIIEYLDTQFAKIDAIKANAEKQLQDAKDLFQSALKDLLTPKEGWKGQCLADLCTLVRGPFGGSLKKDIFVESGYAVYEQQHAIYKNTNIRYFIDESKYLLMKRFSVRPGDLIMSCSGTIGKIFIIPDNAPKGVINQALLKMTPKMGVSANYLAFLIESDYFKEIISSYSDGAAIQNIAAVQFLKELKISIPCFEEQILLVKKLNLLSEKIKELQSNYEQTITLCNDLKQSILKDIFG